jgi:hypothetical protein
VLAVAGLAVAGLAVALDFELVAAGRDLLGCVAAVPVAAVVRLVAVDFVPVVCLDLVVCAVAGAAVAARPVAVGFVPAVAILAAVPGSGLVAYFDLVGRAGLCLGLAACFALVAAARTVDPSAVALYLCLSDLVAVRKSVRLHQERTVKCLHSQIE